MAPSLAPSLSGHLRSGAMLAMRRPSPDSRCTPGNSPGTSRRAGQLPSGAGTYRRRLPGLKPHTGQEESEKNQGAHPPIECSDHAFHTSLVLQRGHLTDSASHTKARRLTAVQSTIRNELPFADSSKTARSIMAVPPSSSTTPSQIFHIWPLATIKLCCSCVAMVTRYTSSSASGTGVLRYEEDVQFGTESCPAKDSCL